MFTVYKVSHLKLSCYIISKSTAYLYNLEVTLRLFHIQQLPKFRKKRCVPLPNILKYVGTHNKSAIIAGLIYRYNYVIK